MMAHLKRLGELGWENHLSGERETETEIDIERHRETETERHRERETHRERDRQREREFLTQLKMKETLSHCFAASSVKMELYSHSPDFPPVWTLSLWNQKPKK